MIINARSSGFGATVSGVTVGAPIPDAQIDDLRAALDRYGVLVLHDQQFTDEQQLAFCERFGTVEHTPTSAVNA